MQKFIILLEGIILTVIVEVLVANLLARYNASAYVTGITGAVIGFIGALLTEYISENVLQNFRGHKEDENGCKKRKSAGSK